MIPPPFFPQVSFSLAALSVVMPLSFLSWSYEFQRTEMLIVWLWGGEKKKKQFLLNKAALQNLGCFRKNENKMCAGVVSWKCRNYRQKNASCCCLPHESSPGLARGWETLLSQISSQQQRLKSVSMADYCFTSCCMLQLKKQCRITAIGSI